VCSVKFGELCGKNSNGAQMVTFFTKAEAIWKNSFRFAELWFTELRFYKFRKNVGLTQPLSSRLRLKEGLLILRWSISINRI
jgi:hypothetical protein